MNANILSIDHIQILAPVGCEEKARKFYDGILGLEELEVPLKTELLLCFRVR